MKILYISNRLNINETEALTYFQFYCDSSDLILRTNIEDAKLFIEEALIQEDNHIDLIVTDWNFSGTFSSILLNWIRESRNRYSEGNFQVRSLPIILIEDRSTQSSSISEGFDGVISDFPNNQYQTRERIKSAIKAWRLKLADDLELIGLNPETQLSNLSHRKSFISYYKLRVLTRHFVDNKSKSPLNYLWFRSDSKVLRTANSRFQDEMDHALKWRPRFMEKMFHEFFQKNPTFIKGEDYYSTHEYLLWEKHFYIGNSRRYNEPDFMNKPLNYALRHPEIFEIKRPTQRLVNLKRTRLLSLTRKSFEQVVRYKDYMTSNDPNNQFYIEKHMGQVYNSFEYSLLIGTLEEKLENHDLIERLKEDFEFSDINLITYEELLMRHIKLCDRLEDFRVF